MASRRRLVKSRDNRMLFGVAGGLAEYFDVDPVLVRVGFVALVFVGGAGLLAYIILAIAMPSPSARAAGTLAPPAPSQEGPAPESVPAERPGREEGWRQPRILLGLFLVGVGVVFLLSNLGLFGFHWGQVWALVLIAIGVVILAASFRRS